MRLETVKIDRFGVISRSGIAAARKVEFPFHPGKQRKREREKGGSEKKKKTVYGQSITR